MNAKMIFDEKTSDEKKKETPIAKDLQNLVEDLKDYKATRQLKEYARRKKEQECRAISSESSIENEIEQIEGLEKEFTWPKGITELDFDRPIGEDSPSLEEIHKDPRGPGFVQSADPNLDEGENSDTLSLRSDSEKIESLVSRKIVFACIFIFVLAAAASLLAVFIRVQQNDHEKKSHDKREIYPNSSSVKIFSDAYNVISWEDPSELIPDEIKQKIERFVTVGKNAVDDAFLDTFFCWKSDPRAYSFIEELMLAMVEYVGVEKTVGSFERTFLMIAAEIDGAKLVGKFIEKGAKTQAVDVNGCTALHYAAKNGMESSCKALLENGAYVNAQTKRGTTPLIHAAYGGHVKIVKILLDAGADPKIKDSLGATALKRATKENCKEIIKVHEANLRKN